MSRKFGPAFEKQISGRFSAAVTDAPYCNPDWVILTAEFVAPVPLKVPK